MQGLAGGASNHSWTASPVWRRSESCQEPEGFSGGKWLLVIIIATVYYLQAFNPCEQSVSLPQQNKMPSPGVPTVEMGRELQVTGIFSVGDCDSTRVFSFPSCSEYVPRTMIHAEKQSE